MGKGLLCGVAVGVSLMMGENVLCVDVVGVLSVLFPGCGASCVVVIVVFCHALACSSLQRLMLSCPLMLQRQCESSSIDSWSCDIYYAGSVTCVFLLKKMLEEDNKKALFKSFDYFP